MAVLPASTGALARKANPTEATLSGCGILTAYGALIHFGRIAKGDFVLITAASSSVGLAAIEIIKDVGAISIATTRTAKKKTMLLELGADHVIVTDEEELPTRVKEITDGKGARIVFDPVAGKGLDLLAEAAAPGGTIFVYGALSTDPTPFPLFSALGKGLTFRGYTLFEIVAVPELRAKAEKYIFDRLQAGIFKPKIARTFPLAQIVDAHRFME